MDLTFHNGYIIPGNRNETTSEQYIKESRRTRQQKIEQKINIHRKNPKSLAYYASMVEINDIVSVNTTIKQVDECMESDTMSRIYHDATNKKDVQFKAGASIKFMSNLPMNNAQLTSNEVVPDIDENIVNSAKTNSAKVNNSKVKSKKKHQRNESQPHQNPDSENKINNKLKGKLQLMFQSLAKVMKKEGVFLDTNSSFERIVAMKDYNVKTKFGNFDGHLSLRAVVGAYYNFRQSVMTHGDHFSEIKAEFTTWWYAASQKYDPQLQLEERIEHIYSNVDSRILRGVKSLEAKLILSLKKPTKQPHGFMSKIDSIYQSWYDESIEIINIEHIENTLNLNSYENSFPKARSIKRKFTICIGPTNSGKTYHAMNELAKSSNGIYLAPLRLMAQEGQESLFERAVLADLLTGEERTSLPGATHTSSTIEMCNMNRIIDTAVIDEIQMIADESRGWAWSAAMIGVPAKHVLLVGSEEALPFILPIIKTLGEEYEIKRFTRKNPLEIHDSVWKLQELRKGDAVVVFSRKSALEMKNAIEATGKKCSVVYGNLSPEVRRQEANKFKSGENPILVATDAIGMGLNLPINRIFFSTLEKFDGMTTRQLTISEIKQIAGRAGRYGLSSIGEVGILADDSLGSYKLLEQAIYGGYETATDTRISIAPNLQQIQTICEVIGKTDLYSALIFFKEKLIRDHKHYKAANLEAMIEIAGLLKNRNLDLATGLNYACVPIDLNSDLHVKHFHRWLSGHIGEKPLPSPRLPEVVTYQKNDSYSLYEAENYVKLCMAYRWLHYKYPEYYPDIETVVENGKMTNIYIEKTLHHHVVISQNPKWRR